MYLNEKELNILKKYEIPKITNKICCEYAIRYRQYSNNRVIDVSIQQDHVLCFKILTTKTIYNHMDLVILAINENSFYVFSYLIRNQPQIALHHKILFHCCIQNRKLMLEYCMRVSNSKYIQINIHHFIIIIIRPVDPRILNFLLQNMEPNILSNHRKNPNYITFCIQFGLIETLTVLNTYKFAWPENPTEIITNSIYAYKILPIIVNIPIELNWSLLFKRLIKFHCLYVHELVVTLKFKILTHFSVFIDALSVHGCSEILHSILTIIPNNMYNELIIRAIQNNAYWICQYVYANTQIEINTDIVSFGIEHEAFVFLNWIVKQKNYTFNLQHVELSLSQPRQIETENIILANCNLTNSETTLLISNLLCQKNYSAVERVLQYIKNQKINTAIMFHIIDIGNTILLRLSLPRCTTQLLKNAIWYSFHKKHISCAVILTHEFLKRKLK